MLIQVFSRHATRKIKAFAENWVKPQLEGRPVAFHRGVQRKPGEFAARNTLRDQTQRKLVAELDLFVAKLNSERRGTFFKRHPALTLLLSAASFVFSFVPQWGASVWSLFSSRPLVPYLIEKIPALENISVGFNWNFVTMPIGFGVSRSEEHTSELQSRVDLVCR